MRFRGSLATRVALLTAIAVGLAVSVLSAVAFLFVRHQTYSALDQSLVNRAHAASQGSAMVTLTLQEVPPYLLGVAEIQLAMLGSDGFVANGGGKIGGMIQLGRPELEVARGRSELSLRTLFTTDGPYRTVAVPGHDPGTALIIAQPIASVRDSLEHLGVLLALSGLAGVVVAGIAGMTVAANGLSPVRRLTAAVEEIARTERLDPIAVEGEDEIARLATAFNATLAALSASRDRQRQLVADAGHELRTPLTSLRTNLELLAQADTRGGLSAQSRTELMDDVRFQINELTTLIGDLTELARDEPIASHLELVDLAEVVDRAVDRVRRRASRLHFDVLLEPWEMLGEQSSLERMVTNLLDNAAKWSPPLGVVTVRLDHGMLTVADQGSGIDAEDLPHIFDRFYRSKESRTMPGSGLGLSIVQSIAARHGASIGVGRALGGGAEFRVAFPAPAPVEEVKARTRGALSATSVSPRTLES